MYNDFSFCHPQEMDILCTSTAKIMYFIKTIIYHILGILIILKVYCHPPTEINYGYIFQNFSCFIWSSVFMMWVSVLIFYWFKFGGCSPGLVGWWMLGWFSPWELKMYCWLGTQLCKGTVQLLQAMDSEPFPSISALGQIGREVIQYTPLTNDRIWLHWINVWLEDISKCFIIRHPFSKDKSQACETSLTMYTNT